MIVNYQSILNLHDFYKHTKDTYSPLLMKVSQQDSFWTDNPMLGKYLIQILQAAVYAPIADAEAQIIQGNKYFEGKHPLEQGKTHPMGICYFNLIFH
jgi:hypothetical protein